MLQENSQKIRWYRVWEAFNEAMVAAFIFVVGALFVTGLLAVLNYFDPIVGMRLLLLRSVFISSIVIGVVAVIAFLCGRTMDVPTGDWLAKVRAGTIVLDKETRKVVEVQVEDVVLLKNHPIFGERYQFLVLDDKQGFSTTVHPVTENPKVRDITCRLVLKIKERSCQNLQALFDFLHLHKMWKVGRDSGFTHLGETEVVWETPAVSMLYDFCNAHSRELSDLFNPLRKDQVERFESMVHDYFDPLLAHSGVEIESCEFLVH